MFSVQVGSRKECAMFPWLFNLCMDGGVKELNERVIGRVNGSRDIAERRILEANRSQFADHYFGNRNGLQDK